MTRRPSINVDSPNQDSFFSRDMIVEQSRYIAYETICNVSLRIINAIVHY